MSKHTPGPWHLAGDSEGIMVTDRHASRIAMWPPQGGTIEQCANARLIAAAPIMSDTLKRAAHILAELSDQSPKLIALRSQIVECIRQATPEHYGIKS